MDVKIFSTKLVGVVETELNKLESQIKTYIRNKEIVSICQSIKQEGQESRIIITVVIK